MPPFALLFVCVPSVLPFYLDIPIYHDQAGGYSFPAQANQLPSGGLLARHSGWRTSSGTTSCCARQKYQHFRTLGLGLAPRENNLSSSVSGLPRNTPHTFSWRQLCGWPVSFRRPQWWQLSLACPFSAILPSCLPLTTHTECCLKALPVFHLSRHFTFKSSLELLFH